MFLVLHFGFILAVTIAAATALRLKMCEMKFINEMILCVINDLKLQNKHVTIFDYFFSLLSLSIFTHRFIERYFYGPLNLLEYLLLLVLLLILMVLYCERSKLKFIRTLVVVVVVVCCCWFGFFLCVRCYD